MKVVILTGSRHKNGTSFLLADKFCEGAGISGHEVIRYDAALMNVKGCTGCNACKQKGCCIQKDDFEAIIADILAADMIVFVTPVYFYGMTAQLKAVIDRFHSVGSRLMERAKQSILMSTCADTAPEAVKALVLHFESILSYLGWEKRAVLTAMGVPDRASVINTAYPEKARRLGENI